MVDATVIVHYDEHGEIQYFVHGDNVCLYIVDERAPDDRVYEWLPRAADDEIAAIIPAGEYIGNSKEDRHKVLAHRINALHEGKPHLSAVCPTEDTE